MKIYLVGLGSSLTRDSKRVEVLLDLDFPTLLLSFADEGVKSCPALKGTTNHREKKRVRANKP